MGSGLAQIQMQLASHLPSAFRSLKPVHMLQADLSSGYDQAIPKAFAEFLRVGRRSLSELGGTRRIACHWHQIAVLPWNNKGEHLLFKPLVT